MQWNSLPVIFCEKSVRAGSRTWTCFRQKFHYIWTTDLITSWYHVQSVWIKIYYGAAELYIHEGFIHVEEKQFRKKAFLMRLKKEQETKMYETESPPRQIPFYKDIWDATFEIISTKSYRLNERLWPQEVKWFCIRIIINQQSYSEKKKKQRKTSMKSKEIHPWIWMKYIFKKETFDWCVFLLHCKNTRASFVYFWDSFHINLSWI